MMILVSHGEDNARPYMAQVMPRLLSSTVELNSIVISDKADKQYMGVSNELTGGSAFYTPDANDLYRGFRMMALALFKGLSGDRLQEVR